MSITPTIDGLISELTQLRDTPASRLIVENNNLTAEVASLKDRLQRMQNDIGFYEVTLENISQIVHLPGDQTMGSLEAWVRKHWRPPAS